MIGTLVLKQETTVFFKKALQWNFIGSSLYEITKVFHNFYLLSCMSNYHYGQMGFILSSIYLAIRIADIGNAYGTVPLLQDMNQSRKAFRYIVGNFFILPQLPILLASATILGGYIQPTLQGLATAIFFLEAFRLFLRYLLHAQFENAAVVSIELFSFAIFLGTIWIPYFLGNTLTPKSILIAHLADSSFALLLLAGLAGWKYLQLPSDNPLEKLPSAKIILTSKMYPYLNRLSREITSSNTLTPMYAVLFGYERVSIFYFLGIATTAYQMIIKNTITYSGNALLAQMRYASPEHKAGAFHMITEKLLLFLAIPLATILLFYHNIQKIVDPSLLQLLLCFLILMGIDLLMHVYEQYYLVQNAAGKYFTFKVVESAACLTVFYIGPTWGIIQAFSTFVAIKLIITIATILHAWNTWSLSFKWRRLATFTGAALGGGLLLKIIFCS